MSRREAGWDGPLVVARGMLAILAAREAGRVVKDSLWLRLFATDGYRRLQARERAMGREFEDSSFRAFLMSDTLLPRAPALRRTLAARRQVPLERSAARARAYLPPGTRLRARVYPRSSDPPAAPALLEVLCDSPALLRRYNEAVRASARQLPRWSDELLVRIAAP